MPRARRVEPFRLLLQDEDRQVFTVVGPMTDDTEWGSRVNKAQAEKRRLTIYGTEHRSIPLEQVIAETQQSLAHIIREG
jgi:hypothetical protein